jgi:hypothetical protein
MISQLKSAVQKLEDNVSKPSISTYDLEKASESFTKTILGESDKNENLDAYEAAYQKNMRAVSLESSVIRLRSVCAHDLKEKNLPEDDNTRFLLQRPFYTGPGHEKRANFEYAMRCFVGGVLRSMNEGSVGAEAKETEMT